MPLKISPELRKALVRHEEKFPMPEEIRRAAETIITEMQAKLAEAREAEIQARQAMHQIAKMPQPEWQTVPAVPTTEMIQRALKEVDKRSYYVSRGHIDADDLITSYLAMLAAAPPR